MLCSEWSNAFQITCLESTERKVSFSLSSPSLSFSLATVESRLILSFLCFYFYALRVSDIGISSENECDRVQCSTGSHSGRCHAPIEISSPLINRLNTANVTKKKNPTYLESDPSWPRCYVFQVSTLGQRNRQYQDLFNMTLSRRPRLVYLCRDSIAQR